MGFRILYLIFFSSVCCRGCGCCFCWYWDSVSHTIATPILTSTRSLAHRAMRNAAFSSFSINLSSSYRFVCVQIMAFKFVVDVYTLHTRQGHSHYSSLTHTYRAWERMRSFPICSYRMSIYACNNQMPFNAIPCADGGSPIKIRRGQKYLFSLIMHWPFYRSHSFPLSLSLSFCLWCVEYRDGQSAQTVISFKIKRGQSRDEVIRRSWIKY